METLRSLVTENATLRTEAIYLVDSIETLGIEKRRAETLALDVLSATSNAKKIKADAETLKNWNTKLVGVVRVKGRSLRWRLHD